MFLRLHIYVSEVGTLLFDPLFHLFILRCRTLAAHYVQPKSSRLTYPLYHKVTHASRQEVAQPLEPAHSSLATAMTAPRTAIIEQLQHVPVPQMAVVCQYMV